MADKPTLSFRVPAALKRALKRLAAADNRGLSNYVETVLSEHVEKHEAKGARK